MNELACGDSGIVRGAKCIAALNLEHLEHLECGQQPHVQDRGAKKRTQLAGRSASGYGLESADP